MSAPSSSSRPSVDSQHSVPSSPTLHSRNSGATAEHGEGSVDPPPDSHRAHQDDDLARRKQRVRRSGGFLLDAAFSHSPQNRRSYHQPHPESAKAKRSSRLDATRPKDKEREEQADASAISPAQNGELHLGKNRTSVYGNMAQPQTIDPTQLVHMALNLSESRRRNISATQLLAAQSRIASSAQREGSSSAQGPGSSLRQHLNEPRRVSRNISPMGAKSSPSRQMSASMYRSASIALPNSQPFNPSGATLARVEKARAYMELRIEYLRMLDYLPPLKPDATAPGNFVITSSNVPGSPQAHLTRTPSYANKQHNLGRPYNPLQYIRNRRTRARERRSLHYSSDDFLHVHHVRDWVDRIEKHSKLASYRQNDRVQLPKPYAEHAENEEQDEPSKLTRTQKGWVCSPEELFADAYWLEQGDNKILIENRYGGKIFPPAETPNQDSLQPRASKEEIVRHRKSWVEGLHAVSLDPLAGDESEQGSERGRKRRLLPAIHSDSPKGGKHNRRGSRLRMKEDAESSGSETGGGKRKPRLALDTEHNIGPLALLLEQHIKGAQTKTPTFISPDTPNKWGRREVDIPASSNLRNSLEVPRLGDGFAYVKDRGSFKIPSKPRVKPKLSIDENEPRSSFEELDSTAPNTPLQSKFFPRIGDDFSPPGSRANSQTRKSKRSKLNIFHYHEHSKDSKHEHAPGSVSVDKQQAPRQSGEESQDEKHLGTTKLAAPGPVRNLLGHRKNDSVSSLTSPERLRRKDTQEPPSAVTRFFKGVKHEGTKVGEFIFRRDKADDSDMETMSDHNSVDFDTDASTKIARTKRPVMSRAPSDVTSMDSVPGKPGRSNLELPTFRPINQTQVDEGKESDAEDHITRQNRDRKSNRSPRFSKLAPPVMDLGTLSANVSATSLSPIRSHSHDRINTRLAHPGGANPVGLPPTGLRNAQLSDAADGQHDKSRPTLEGKRQWSLADDEKQALQRKAGASNVTQADIARVRAILLSSGVKARELSRRSHVLKSPASDFLTRAAATAKTELFPVPRKEEHVLAARILMKDLELSTQSLHSSLEGFRNNAIRELTAQISQLQSCVDSDLMPRVLDSGDQAIRVMSEVSGQGPLDVKQITDEIDRMLRTRRRRMRWLRRFGWILVEWAVVAFMWWLWLIVVLLRCVRKVCGVGWGILRWFLWI